MKIGDTINTAMWLDGRETPAMRMQYEADVTEAIDTLLNDKVFVRGEVTFVEKLPKSSPRVPDVPDHIQGPDVRLLIAEADIMGVRVVLDTRTFVGDLDATDLDRLRQVTRRAWAVSHPGQLLTDMECDDIIEELGPEAAFDAVRTAVDSQAVH